MHGLPGVVRTGRQEVRAIILHVTEELHFIIARRLVARRKTSRGPPIPFTDDGSPGGIIMLFRQLSSSFAHAPPPLGVSIAKQRPDGFMIS
jgi:hypothetical protein